MNTFSDLLNIYKVFKEYSRFLLASYLGRKCLKTPIPGSVLQCLWICMSFFPLWPEVNQVNICRAEADQHNHVWPSSATSHKWRQEKTEGIAEGITLIPVLRGLPESHNLFTPCFSLSEKTLKNLHESSYVCLSRRLVNEMEATVRQVHTSAGIYLFLLLPPSGTV